MSGIPKIEVCEHCRRRVKEHTLAWVMWEPGNGERPDEDDTEELAWGPCRLLVRCVEKRDGFVCWAGMKVAQTVCQACWDAGKKFKEKKKPSAKKKK